MTFNNGEVTDVYRLSNGPGEITVAEHGIPKVFWFTRSPADVAKLKDLKVRLHPRFLIAGDVCVGLIDDAGQIEFDTAGFMKALAGHGQTAPRDLEWRVAVVPEHRVYVWDRAKLEEVRVADLTATEKAAMKISADTEREGRAKLWAENELYGKK